VGVWYKNGVDPMAMARDERAELADFLASLRPDQWNQPSLCEGWSVKDVVAHAISGEDLGPIDLARDLARARFHPGAFVEIMRADKATLEPAQLIAFLREHLTPGGLRARFRGRVGLIDALIHHQDIRRPLGLSRQIPPERVTCALPFAVIAPPIRGFWHGRGVRLIATDIDWSRGKGPEARGTGEAVLLALAGRRSVARELTGPGASILQQRLG
jgi:uncharacterized protein (TIGR03083 family)